MCVLDHRTLIRARRWAQHGRIRLAAAGVRDLRETEARERHEGSTGTTRTLLNRNRVVTWWFSVRKSPHAWNRYFLPMHRQCSSCSRAWAVYKLCRLILNINVKDVVCVSERLQVFVSVCLECVCVCVFMCLLGSRLPVWADGLSISLQNRELMCSGSVCVFMSGQVWRYEEADGVYGDGGDGGTTHTGIRAQWGDGRRWHWWVCDVISWSQWRDSLMMAELWAKTITAFLNRFGRIEGLSGRISMSVAAHDSLVRRRASGVLSFSAWHLQINEKIICSIRAAAPH